MDKIQKIMARRNALLPLSERDRELLWRKRSIPTHSGWLYPLTFDAGKGLKEA